MALVGTGLRDKIALTLGATGITSFICDKGTSAPIAISDPETVDLVVSQELVKLNSGASQLYEITDHPVDAKLISIGTPGTTNSYTIAFAVGNQFSYTLPYGRYNVTSLTITVEG